MLSVFSYVWGSFVFLFGCSLFMSSVHCSLGPLVFFFQISRGSFYVKVLDLCACELSCKYIFTVCYSYFEKCKYIHVYGFIAHIIYIHIHMYVYMLLLVDFELYLQKLSPLLCFKELIMFSSFFFLFYIQLSDPFGIHSSVQCEVLI